MFLLLTIGVLTFSGDIECDIELKWVKRGCILRKLSPTCPINTGCKLVVQETFILLNVLRTFNLCPVSSSCPPFNIFIFTINFFPVNSSLFNVFIILLNVALRFILLSLWTKICYLILGLLQRSTGVLEAKFTARCGFCNRSGNHTGELVVSEDCTGTMIFSVGIRIS